MYKTLKFCTEHPVYGLSEADWQWRAQRSSDNLVKKVRHLRLLWDLWCLIAYFGFLDIKALFEALKSLLKVSDSGDKYEVIGLFELLPINLNAALEKLLRF